MVGTITRSTIALLVAGAASAVLGVGTASAATTAPATQPAPATAVAAQPWRWDYCDDWNHRWDRGCYQQTRWYWNGDRYGHGQWQEWRKDNRGHWDHRGDSDNRGFHPGGRR